jgi:hypothetical protein
MYGLERVDSHLGPRECDESRRDYPVLPASVGRLPHQLLTFVWLGSALLTCIDYDDECLL